MYLLIACAIVSSAVAAAKTLTTECAAPSNPQLANATNTVPFPVDPIGAVAAVLLPIGTGRSILYYQNQQGDIVQHGIEGGSFFTGHTTSVTVLATANSTRRGTPIAVSVVPIQGHSQTHIYYITPRCTLAETRLVFPTWLGGTGAPCPQCIDSANFVVVEGSQVLYAIQDKDNVNILRVGFESPTMPGTISEAVTTNFGTTWQIAPVPGLQA